MNDTNTTLPSVDAIVRVKQIPIIEEQLRALKDEVEHRTAAAMSLVCTVDTVQTVKEVRADLNRQFAELEEARKNAKKQIMEPYNRFEEVYKECVTDLFRRADADLKGKVDAVEGELKAACEERLQSYFNELRDVKGLTWLEYERAGVKVDMASAKSKTPKKLMEQIKIFVESVAQTVALIEDMEDAPEIMAEYKATLSLAQSVATVKNRKQRIEAERAAAEERARREAERKAKEEATAASAPSVEAFAPPVAAELPKAVQEAAVKRYSLEISVEGTLEQMRLFRQYLTSNGYQYKVGRFAEVTNA